MNVVEKELTEELRRTKALLNLALFNSTALNNAKKYRGKNVIVLSDSYQNVKRFAITLTLLEYSVLSNELDYRYVREINFTDRYLGTKCCCKDCVIVDTTAGNNQKVIQEIIEGIKANSACQYIIYAKSPETLVPELADLVEGISFDFSLFNDCSYIDDALKEAAWDAEYVEAKEDDDFEDDGDYGDTNDNEESYYDASSNSTRASFDYQRQQEMNEQYIKQQSAFQEEQLRFQQQQNQIAKEQAKAPIQAQIASLRAEAVRREAAYYANNGLKGGNFSERRAIDALYDQIALLEEQLRRI